MSSHPETLAPPLTFIEITGDTRNECSRLDSFELIEEKSSKIFYYPTGVLPNPQRKPNVSSFAALVGVVLEKMTGSTKGVEMIGDV